MYIVNSIIQKNNILIGSLEHTEYRQVSERSLSPTDTSTPTADQSPVTPWVRGGEEEEEDPGQEGLSNVCSESLLTEWASLWQQYM